MEKDLFWNNSVKTLLKGLLDKHGKDYLKNEMKLFSDNTQDAIIATAKQTIEERMNTK